MTADATRILTPAEITRTLEDSYRARITGPQGRSFGQAIPAGAFIGLGFVFYVTTQVGATALPHGMAKLVGGLVFSLGLSLVVLTGSELFTGSTLGLMPLAGRRVTAWQLLRNWCVVYAGNFVGAVGLAALVFAAGLWRQDSGGWGAVVLTTASTKLGRGFGEAFALGVLCNLLVCLGVWLAAAGRTSTDKILGLTLPVALFVASGCEHSVANMFLVPLALFITQGADPSFWSAVPLDAAAGLTWERFVVANLVPVTLGNVVGGGVLVGLYQWMLHGRR